MDWLWSGLVESGSSIQMAPDQHAPGPCVVSLGVTWTYHFHPSASARENALRQMKQLPVSCGSLVEWNLTDVYRIVFVENSAIWQLIPGIRSFQLK